MKTSIKTVVAYILFVVAFVASVNVAQAKDINPQKVYVVDPMYVPANGTVLTKVVVEQGDGGFSILRKVFRQAHIQRQVTWKDVETFQYNLKVKPSVGDVLYIELIKSK